MNGKIFVNLGTGVAYEKVSQEKTPPHEQKNHFFLLTVSAPGTGNVIVLNPHVIKLNGSFSIERL